MKGKPSITFVGAGALVHGLALPLKRAGYFIDEIIVRDKRRLKRAAVLAKETGAEVNVFDSAQFKSQLIWIAVSDGAIEPVARRLASEGNWKGKIVLHSSGALSSTALAALRERGAITASLHPMMTFVKSHAPSLAGVWFAVEGPAANIAARIAKNLGGRAFRITEGNKSLYHAFGSLLSPLLVSELTAAEAVGKAVGLKPSEVRRVMAPIVTTTVENFLKKGGAAALSGPLIRGDVETIAKHEAVLTGNERDVYLALTRYATRALPVKHQAEINNLLGDTAATKKGRKQKGRSRRPRTSK